MNMKTLSLVAGFCVAFAGQAVVGAQPAGHVIQWGFNVTMNVTAFPDVDYYTTNTVAIGGTLLSNAVAIAAGADHALALRADSTVVAWGANGPFGKTLGIASHDVARTSGVVTFSGQVLTNVIAVAAGRSSGELFSLALERDGTVKGWGESADGAINTHEPMNLPGGRSLPAGLSSVVAVAAGAFQGLALKKDGTVVSWGQGNPPPKGLSNVVAIAAGGANGRNLALKHDGTVVQWAVGNVDNPSAMPAGLSNIVAISAGSGHCLALKQDGMVVAWGLDGQGGPVRIKGEILRDVVTISAGNEYSLALKKDGTVVTWGHPFGPLDLTPPAGLSNVVAIAAGPNFCLAITTNAAVAARFAPSK